MNNFFNKLFGRNKKQPIKKPETVRNLGGYGSASAGYRNGYAANEEYSNPLGFETDQPPAHHHSHDSFDYGGGDAGGGGSSGSWDSGSSSSDSGSSDSGGSSGGSD